MLLEYKEYVKEIEHELVGVVVLYNNKILLVKPKKFKNKLKKWSIPKGHVENDNLIQSALDELSEESSLNISKKKLKKSKTDKVIYIKNGIKKDLTYYIIKLTKKELNVKLFNNMILGNFLNGETREAGFFSKKDASKLIEKQQIDILKYLD